jgi:TPR repeat protein
MHTVSNRYQMDTLLYSRLNFTNEDYDDEDYDNIEKHHMMLIKSSNNSDVNAMCQLAHFYKFVKKDNVQMEKYYDMAATLGSLDAIMKLVDYHKYQTRDYFRMEKYLIKAATINNIEAIETLIDYYAMRHNRDEMVKYCMIAMSHPRAAIIGTYHHLVNYYNYDKLKLYHLLKDTTHDYIKDKLEILKENEAVQFYIKALETATQTNNIKECLICTDEKLCILYRCNHHVCCDCFVEFPRCYYRCPGSEVVPRRQNEFNE